MAINFPSNPTPGQTTVINGILYRFIGKGQWIQVVNYYQKEAIRFPAGTVVAFESNSIPSGWVTCDGRRLDLVLDTFSSSTNSQGYTVDASSYYADWQPWKAFNGVTGGEGWHSNSTTTPHWITITGNNPPVSVSQIKMYERTGLTQRLPSDLSFYGSNDGTNWTLIQSFTGYTQASSLTFNVTTPVPFSNWKLEFNLSFESGTIINISEIELFDADSSLSGINSPDLRAAFVRGWDNGRGIDSGRAVLSTQNSGSTTSGMSFSLNTASSHNHYARGSGSGVVGGAGSEAAESYSATLPASGSHNHTFSLNGPSASDTRPRNLALNYIIKTTHD